MNKLQRFFVVLLAVFMLLTSVSVGFYAETVFESNGFLYVRSSSSTVDIYGRESTDSSLAIPKTLDGYYVSRIIDSAFSGDQNVETLDLSKAVLLETIGYYAFANCPRLSGSIRFSGRISSLGASAFQNCPLLEGVSFTNSFVTMIPAQCFYNCYSLNNVVLSEKVKSIEKLAFANCTSLKEITIPASVETINPSAFNGCDDLTIYCYTESAAHQFAINKEITFVLLDAPAPTEPPTEEPTVAPTEEPTTAPTETPTLEPTEAPTEAVVPILGDADGNGVIEVDDATFIQRVIAELPVPYPMEMLMHGEVDGDGELTITDATLIQRYVAEMPVNYPIGEPV